MSFLNTYISHFRLFFNNRLLEAILAYSFVVSLLIVFGLYFWQTVALSSFLFIAFGFLLIYYVITMFYVRYVQLFIVKKEASFLNGKSLLYIFAGLFISSIIGFNVPLGDSVVSYVFFGIAFLLSYFLSFFILINLWAFGMEGVRENLLGVFRLGHIKKMLFAYIFTVFALASFLVVLTPPVFTYLRIGLSFQLGVISVLCLTAYLLVFEIVFFNNLSVAYESLLGEDET